MNDLVRMHDFLDKIASFLIVHRPDFFDALVIRLFKPLKALLKLDELVSEKLVVLSILSVIVLRFDLLIPKFYHLGT